MPDPFQGLNFPALSHQLSPERTRVTRDAAILEHAPRVSAFALASYFPVRNAAHERVIRDRVRALTSTIQAFEQGLGALREGMRRTAIREKVLGLFFRLGPSTVGTTIAIAAKTTATTIKMSKGR